MAARDLCTLADVVRYAPGYTAGDDADTDATLTTLITAVSREVHRAAGRIEKSLTCAASAIFQRRI